MQKIISTIFMISVFFVACNLNNAQVDRSDPLEAGREFITASLKGNYDQAKKYVLPDSTNMDYFSGMENFNNKFNSKEKDGYKNANIIIDSIQTLSDSVTIINYSNSFKKKPDRIKLVKVKNEWYVDFKFTFSGNSNYGD